jgi:hypothetical protein
MTLLKISFAIIKLIFFGYYYYCLPNKKTNDTLLMNNNNQQVQEHVNANSICIITIATGSGYDNYTVNISGNLTAAENKFFRYIGKPDYAENRPKWKRSVDVTDMFTNLLTEPMPNNINTYVNHFRNEYGIYDITAADLQSINSLPNRQKWLTYIYDEEFQELTDYGRYPLRVVVVNHHDFDDGIGTVDDDDDDDDEDNEEDE